MSQKDKLIERMLKIPSDFRWDELVKILNSLGINEVSKGKTAGSRRSFIRTMPKIVLLLHEPHPQTILGRKTLRDIVQKLKESGDLNDYTDL